MRKRNFKKIISWLLAAAITGQPLLAASSPVVADANAPGKHRPIVVAAANGVPVVQITTPSAAGISRNQYSQLNIEKQGLIFNNSLGNRQTQLGGYIYGNPYLARGTARIILNEVTGPDMSRLRGYAEIAGSRAELVIANPHGIVGDGFGFINTSRGILTTGTPVFDGNESLDSFRVTGGTVTVEGSGIDASTTDRADIISQAAIVNAGVWAKELNVVTGANQVSYDSLQTEKITGDQSQVAIDVGSLGGMYAQKIYLVGTDKGVGVNTAGTLEAQAGDITITNAGQVLLAGKTSAIGNITVSAEGNVTNKNTLYAQENTNIITQGVLENSGIVAAVKQTTLSAQSITSTGTLGAGVKTDGTIGTAGDLTLNATGTILAQGQNTAAGNLAVTGSGIDLSVSQTYAGANTSLTATAGSIDTTSAALKTNGEIRLQASDAVINDMGVNGTAGQIEASRVTITANSISNKKSLIQQTGTDTTALTAAAGIDNTGGTIRSSGATTVTAGGDLINSSGAIASSGATRVTVGGDLITKSGTIQAVGANANLGIYVDGSVDNTSGTIASNGATILTAGSDLINKGGTIQAAGNVATNLIVISHGAMDNTSGTIAGNGATALMAGGNLINRSGTIQAAGTDSASLAINAGGSVDNTSGTIASSGKETLTVGGDLVTKSGMIKAAGASASLGITTGGSVDNTSGTIASNGETTLTVGGDLGNKAGTIQAAGTNANLSISASGATDNTSGMIASSGANTLTVGNLINKEGTIEAAGTDPAHLSITARSDIDNTSGTIASSGATILTAGSNISNKSGMIQAAGATALLAIHASGAIDNTTGTIASSGVITLTAGSNLSNKNGTIQAAGRSASLAVTTGGAVDNTSGTIASNGKTTLAVGGDLSNIQGTIQSAGESAKLDISAGGPVDNTSGTIASNGVTTLTVGALINQGGTVQASGADGVNLGISARGAIENRARNGQGGILVASGSTNITANSLNNTQGQITAGQELNVGATQGITNVQGLLAATKNVSVSGSQIDNTQGTIGSVQGQTGVSASTGPITNQAGRIEAAQQVTIASVGLNNRDGVIVGDSLQATSNGQVFDNTRGKVVAMNGAATIASGALTNEAGLMQAAGLLAIDTSGQTLANTNSGASGGLVGQGGITLTTGDLINRAGYVSSGGTLTVRSAAIDNTQGGIVASMAQLDMNGSSLNNQNGQIQALGNVGIDLSGTLDNTSSLVRSGQALRISAGAIANGGTQGANQGLDGQTVSLAAYRIDNRLGAVRADSVLTLAGSGTIDNSQGLISSGQILTLQDSNSFNKTLFITNSGGTLIAGQQLGIDSAGLSGDGKVLSQGDLSVKLTQDYIHSAELQANGNLSLETTGTITNQSKLLAKGNLTIRASNIDNPENSEISAQNTTVAVTGTLTNRGLIDGGETLIKAGTLANLGKGRIYGDHLAIGANTLTNDVEDEIAPVIAARDRLDIGAQTITNREHSLLFSAGDLAIGGSLNASNRATGQADLLNNNSATIEALGNASLAVRQINNTNEHFSTYVPVISVESIVQYQGSGSPNRYLMGTPGVNIYNDESDQLRTPERCYDDWTAYRYTRTITETKVEKSDPAKILSGGAMQINADTLTNDKSNIVAGGTLSGSIGTLDNKTIPGDHIITDIGTATSYWRNHKSGRDDTGSRAVAYNPPAVVQKIVVNPTVYEENTAPAGTGTQVDALVGSTVNQAATGANAASVTSKSGAVISPITQVTTPAGTRQVNSSGSAVNPVATNPGGALVSPIRQVTSLTGNGIVRSGSVNTTIPNSSLFTVNPNPNASYLVETDPRFANYKNWLSSDYMFQALKTDPSTTQKRLGDGFYEQKLIRDQVTELTGQRFLNGYSSDEAQYKALMNNGVHFAEKYQLNVGVALSAEQMAQLTSDIVWLVEKEVVLPNGEVTRALVPELYVCNLKEGDLSASGALISGNNVDLAISGDLTNSGTIAGRNTVSVTADNIRNLGGRISGSDVNLQSRTDLENLGGRIEAANNLTAIAGRDLTVASNTRSQLNSQGSVTNVESVAGLYVTGDKGSLAVSAGRDMNLLAAQITNSGLGGGTSIAAGHNINLGTVTESTSNHIVWDSNNQRSDSSRSEVGTTIQTPGTIRLQAGNDVNARAATVESSQGDLLVAAGHDVNLSAGETSVSVDEAHQHKGRSGMFSSTTTTTRDTLSETSAQGTTLSGDTTTVAAGRDIQVAGSNVVATHDVNLSAAGNIAITSVQETRQEEHMKKEQTSGLFGSGGLGFTIGTKSVKTTDDQQGVSQAGSTVGSVNGNVTIQAGQDVKVTASDLMSGKDTTIAGQNVTIESAGNRAADKQTVEYKQSGLSVSVGNQTLDNINSVAQPLQRSSQVSDDRLKALYDYKAAKAADNLLQGKNPSGTGPASTDNSLKISVSLGTSKQQSETNSSQTTAQQSTVTAGGNLTVKAVEDINVTGSKLSGENINLTAGKDVNLKSAENTTNSQTTGSSSSAGVGVSMSANHAPGFSIEGSKSRNQGDGNTVTHTDTTVTAGDTLTIKSGQDTNLIGAQAKGDTVKVDAGRNLNLESQQDLDKYKETSSSAGGKLEIGVGSMSATGSASRGKVDSNYQSVTNQTGIEAGKGGFDIQVGKNTDLKGAVISSTATPDKNKLSTDTLTYSDIQNKADYSANSVGVNVNTNPNAKLNEQGITPDIGIPSSGNANSTTKSAIAPGTIEVRSNPNQDLSGLSRSTDQAVNALGKIFDKKTVQEQQELAKVFGEEAFKAVGDLALKEYTKASGDAVKAKLAGNDIAYQEAMQRQAAWAIGGQNEILLHGLVGGITSALGGSSFTSGAAGSAIGELVQGQLKNLSPGIQILGSALVGSVAAKLAGGNAQTGAAIAASGTINNGLSHEHQEQLVNDLTYAINNDSKAGIVTTLLKWSGVDTWNYYTQEAGWGESGEDGTINLMNAAAQKLGISFSYDQNDSVHNNMNAFWGSLASSAPSVDTSTLLAAGAATVVVAGVTLYNYNGGWVKAASAGGTGTVWDVIKPTADNIPGTLIPATFQIQTTQKVLWANANSTEHMGEYVNRFGDESWTIAMRSQAMLTSFNAAVQEFAAKFADLPVGRYFETVGGWELGVNTETGVIYHAMPK